MNQNQQSIFEKMAASFGDMSKFDFETVLKPFPGLSLGAIPQARACSDRNDLSLWFRQFAFACRSALPKATP